MTKHFYMPFFTEAYLADTQHLSLEEQGAYMRLLCFMWMRGGYLRDDDKELSRLLGLHVNKWKKIRETLGAFLQKHPPHLLTQKRLIHEYQKAEGKRESKRQNAHARWQGESSKNNQIINADASPPRRAVRRAASSTVDRARRGRRARHPQRLGGRPVT